MLWIAARNRHTAVVEMMIAVGCNKDKAAEDGATHIYCI